MFNEQFCQTCVENRTIIHIVPALVEQAQFGKTKSSKTDKQATNSNTATTKTD